MANPDDRDHEPVRAPRTRTSATWVAVAVAVVFLVLLVDFIAQNNRKVPIYFVGANGRVSLALALIVAAVAGALVVLLISAARIVQLRVVGRRHNRAMRKQQAQTPKQPPQTDVAPSADGS